MTSDVITQIAIDLFTTVTLLALPSVVASLGVGVVISILQTITSIQEQTLSFAPRILAVVLVLVLTTPWMLKVASAFTSRMMLHLVEVGR